MNADSDGVSAWPEDLAARYRELGYWTDKSLDSILSDSAQKFPARTAVVDGECRVTYAELDEEVTRAAVGLARRGISEGARVLVHLPNQLDSIRVILALFRAGAVPILCLPGHRQRELRAFALRSDACAYVGASVIDGADGRLFAAELLSDVESVRTSIIVGDSGRFDSWQEIARAEGAGLEPAVETLFGRGGRLALLQLSGGSTGEPKLIPRTHDDYLYSIRRSTEVCEWSSETVYLLALPWGHNFPMSSPGFLGCLLVGGRVVVAPDASPDTCLRLIEKERVTDTAAVPGVARAWLESLRSGELSLPSLQTIQVGGARLSSELAQDLELYFQLKVQQVFGMAEGLVCYTRPQATQEQRWGTQGLPMSEADELRVADDEDRPVEPGQVGQLLTRGPYTIRGYYRAEATNRVAFTADGFYRTGDLVRQTPDGSVVVEGRVKETINRGGEKISPSELEDLLQRHPDLTEVAVVGSPDLRLGERVVAFYCTPAESELTGSALLSWLRAQQLARFKLPDRFVPVPTMPRTPVGKVDKPALLGFLQEAPQPAQTNEESGGLTVVLAKLLEVPADALSPQLNLLEQGLDSLRLMSLVELFRGWGAEVSLIDLAEEPTIEAFERLLEEHEVGDYLTQPIRSVATTTSS